MHKRPEHYEPGVFGGCSSLWGDLFAGAIGALFVVGVMVGVSVVIVALGG